MITLTTDYGTRDHYVGVLKGVILSIAKKASIFDVTHEISPFGIGHAAFVLRQVWSWYPPGTVHLVVVDPGVGSDRNLLVGQYDDRFVVAPDNGVITFVHRELRLQALHLIENRQFGLPVVSATFHGRDLLAPAAAHLSNGVKPREFGRQPGQIEMLATSLQAESRVEGLAGRVIYVDRFGNLITNVRAEQLAAPRLHAQAWQVSVNGKLIGRIQRTFQDVGVGEAVAYVGSSGYLEIALNRGRANERFKPVDSATILLT